MQGTGRWELGTRLGARYRRRSEVRVNRHGHGVQRPVRAELLRQKRDFWGLYTERGGRRYR
jgi:hypothetical protein